MTDDAFTSAELAARRARGLPEHHAADIGDFPYRFAQTEFRAFHDDAVRRLNAEQTAGAAFNAAFAKVIAGEHAVADRLMAAVEQAEPSNPRGRMRFSQLHLVPPRDLPPVHGEWPRDASIFLSCDQRYFDLFAGPLVRSLRANDYRGNVHVHLVGATLGPLPGPITSTTENPADFIGAHKIEPRDYYNAVRLVRFAELVKKQPAIMVDIDSLAVADPSRLFDLRGPALRVRPGRVEPWNHFSACLLKGDPASADYFITAAHIVRQSIDRAWWGLDQYALFAAYLLRRPDLTLVNSDIADVGDYGRSVFWFTASKNKETLETGGSPYAKLHRRYG